MSDSGEYWKQIKGGMAEKAMAQEGKHSHYYKDVRDIDVLDIYHVCNLYPMNDNSGALAHAVKKILGGGGRGTKGQMQDIVEAIDSLTRWVELNEEGQDE